MKDKIFAIIPAYDEEERVSETVKQVKKFVDEVIVIDDGSKDQTYFEAKKSKAIVLKHIVNMGKGVAMKTGIEYAISKKANKIVLIDADGQHNPKEIPRLLKKLNQFDMVLGSRKMPKNSPVVFKLGNWGLNKIFTILFSGKIEDTQNGFRVFKSEIYPKIKWNSQGYFVETEMIINTLKHKIKYTETPVQTFYHNKYKGTTVLIGMGYFIKMLEVKIGWI
jgi:UDP-N-acetylglucosamine---dolichyl-phosphate N-acetylglucosaminyltransferase